MEKKGVEVRERQFSANQIIIILKEAEVGVSIEELYQNMINLVTIILPRYA